ncbi:hypothetical protein VKS41_003611 [Umbelopsis sp. WA50703]
MNSIADQLAQQGQLIQRLSTQLQQQQVTCSSAMATSPAGLLELSVLPHYEWQPIRSYCKGFPSIPNLLFHQVLPAEDKHTIVERYPTIQG